MALATDDIFRSSPSSSAVEDHSLILEEVFRFLVRLGSLSLAKRVHVTAPHLYI